MISAKKFNVSKMNHKKVKVKMKASARHKARSLALQAIYQWQLNAEPIDYIASQYTDNANPKKVDLAYFSELLRGITTQTENIDNEMTPLLDRKITDLTSIELAILRMAIYELQNRLDIPYKVIINEALELTKEFGAQDAFKYVNGILDKIAHKVRVL
jgi:transcription antitermination protein NusB